MKMKLLFLLAAALCMNTGRAQINLIGAAVNQESGKIDLVKWQALEPGSIEVFPTALDGYLLTTSAFNAYNSHYYLNGIIDQSNTLLGFDSQTNTLSYNAFSAFSNISEIDMSTGLIYTLTSDTEGFIYVEEFNIEAGTDTIIGAIAEPGLMGLVVDAIGFNSNDGVLYYVGPDGNSNYCLFAIAVRSEVFSFEKTILNLPSPFGNITSVQYDNVSNTIFAMNATFDEMGNYTGNYIVDIDGLSGEVSNRGLLAGFPYYLAGSSSYDQNTGNMMVVAFDTAFIQQMIVFSTRTNSFVTGFVPDNVSEIVCDNARFAQNTYITGTAKTAADQSLSIYPNPAHNAFWLSLDSAEDGPLHLSIIDAGGRCVHNEHLNGQQHYNIDVSELQPGFYLVNMVSQQKTLSSKLIIK
ncbi:MAG: T9SS type A sorting domain-containing protein [Bacteroidales bacterium]|nr:T9SS type A sorting domain-containing protein [Bacteroidales bacterium]